jgi:hypothetical protein
MKPTSLSQATGCLQRMAERVGFGIMRRELLKPLVERARASCERDQMTAKARRRVVQSAVDQGGVVFLSVGKPAAGGRW